MFLLWFSCRQTVARWSGILCSVFWCGIVSDNLTFSVTGGRRGRLRSSRVLCPCVRSNLWRMTGRVVAGAGAGTTATTQTVTTGLACRSFSGIRCQWGAALMTCWWESAWARRRPTSSRPTRLCRTDTGVADTGMGVVTGTTTSEVAVTTTSTTSAGSTSTTRTTLTRSITTIVSGLSDSWHVQSMSFFTRND